MMQNQQPMNNGQTHMNMHTGQVPQHMNHGGHEVFDVHELLAGTINTLDQYMMFRQYVQDPELLDILDRQYQFIQTEYNTMVETFKTGQDPTVPTQSYKMNQSNDFVYGLKPSQPKKPNQSLADIKDQGISGHMLGLVKAGAGLKAMTACEMTNPVMRRVVADSIPNCIEMAYEISLYQNKHHYYQVPQLAEQDMQQMLNAYAPAQGQPQMPQPGNQNMH
ncbi:spore coat protein [Priestia abyssalis]|uniref:spore coat protein n=1 Tax=Priestia abyssalis TaxID=1221450 RepID=UPI001959AD6B|nr:spore coat protein [Priestia abyssalis]